MAGCCTVLSRLARTLSPKPIVLSCVRQYSSAVISASGTAEKSLAGDSAAGGDRGFGECGNGEVPWYAQVPPEGDFRLADAFVARYAAQRPPFGFNGLGELVYQRTYSRPTDTTDTTTDTSASNETTTATTTASSTTTTDTSTSKRMEKWPDTLRRVVEGTFSLRQRWLRFRGERWDARDEHRLAERMFDRMFHMKLLPPGRGTITMFVICIALQLYKILPLLSHYCITTLLTIVGLWAMGSPLTRERFLFAALHNCAFVSTGDMYAPGERPSAPFAFLMDASMLG